MEANQIATKGDIARIEEILRKLSEQLSQCSASKQAELPKLLTAKQVMQLLSIKEDALRTLRLNGEIKFKKIGRWRRYPADQFQQPNASKKGSAHA